MAHQLLLLSCDDNSSEEDYRQRFKKIATSQSLRLTNAIGDKKNTQFKTNV